MSETCSPLMPVGATGELTGRQEIPAADASPFIHRFRTRDRAYVYDANTCRIIRVSPAVWDVLEDIGVLNDEQIIRKHSAAHGSAQVAAALAEVARVREQEGLLLSSRPREVIPASAEHIGRELGQRRRQLILNITEACNLRCSYCVFGGGYSQFRTHSDRTMPWATAQRAIDEFLAHSADGDGRVVTFYGGEPLLVLPLIRRCVAYVRQSCPDPAIRFAITTNGMLLRGEAAEFLATEQFLITLSLDGPAAVHDAHRRTVSGEGSFGLVVGNLREFLRLHPQYQTNGALRFSAVVPPMADLRDCQRFWGSEGPFSDSMSLELSVPLPTPSAPATSPTDPLAVSGRALREDFIAALKSGEWATERLQPHRWVQAALFERPLIAFHKREYLTPGLPARMALRNTCVAGARRTFVSVDGDYFACERVPTCPGQKIGDVNSGVSPQRVAAMTRAWSAAGGDQCRNCWCLSHCRVGCFATVEEAGELTARAKQSACGQYRGLLHQLLCDYAEVLEANPNAFDYTADIELA